MTPRRLGLITAVSLGGALLGPASAPSHEFALESVINAFVKIDPQQAHLVVRMPLHLLKPVNFPAIGREIDLVGAEPAIGRALEALGREITLRENGRPLVPSRGIGRLSLPSDRSFEGYRNAVAHVAKPVTRGTTIYADQGFFDAHLTYAITSPFSQFTIRTGVAPELKDYLKVAVRYMPLDEEARAMLITSRSGQVSLNPTWYQAAASFTALGTAHILGGIDHLLFLLCLVIPVRGLREILSIVTTFTAAHSVTLVGAAFGLAPRGAWFPPLVETLIAFSIVYMAVENIVVNGWRRRWLIAGLFGLVHGFGFSYGLRENVQFAGRHLLISLFSFNVGIEIGQVLVLAVLLPVLAVLVRSILGGRVGMIVLSALVAHVGWHWMVERGETLWKVEWPAVDQAGLAVLARWVAAVLLATAGVRFVAGRIRLRRGFGLAVHGTGEPRGRTRGGA